MTGCKLVAQYSSNVQVYVEEVVQQRLSFFRGEQIPLNAVVVIALWLMKVRVTQ